ncbi:olfactory receptor 5V1-like [Microcaecilia unicolor]|uniref:Olfactory receptor n=1 Tax=Microcaecilia unicolor TaxID=1415580 RepID=A0A6P7WW05_9AMPH|nr:olfactory receptor 5V1-like [Microcaecilia unicolor]
MKMGNQTVVTEFILLGLSQDANTKVLLFLVVLFLYFVSLLGNIIIIFVAWVDHHLHNPMYFFLGNLSFLDICYSSVTVPKMLSSLLTETSTISYVGCLTQLYFYLSFCGTECLLLSTMGFDRYVAVCNPLRYTIIMENRVCLQMTVCIWVTGFLTSIIHVIFAAQLSFCASHVIRHFFCDIPPILKLACGDTFLNEILVLTVGGSIGLGSFLLTLVSYAHIISTILMIRSVDRRKKTFSTCASHLTVVTLFFGSLSFMYMRPTSNYSMEQDKMVSVFYAVMTPALNPIIYTLRNNEVKRALKISWRRVWTK